MQVKERHKAIAVIDGTIDNMRGQRLTTGYNRLFTIRWFETFDKENQHHEIPVSAYNEVARLVKGDGYEDGNEVRILGKIKTHKDEIYIELIDIKRIGNETDTEET